MADDVAPERLELIEEHVDGPEGVVEIDALPPAFAAAVVDDRTCTQMRIGRSARTRICSRSRADQPLTGKRTAEYCPLRAPPASWYAHSIAPRPPPAAPGRSWLVEPGEASATHASVAIDASPGHRCPERRRSRPLVHLAHPHVDRVRDQPRDWRIARAAGRMISTRYTAGSATTPRCDSGSLVSNRMPPFFRMTIREPAGAAMRACRTTSPAMSRSSPMPAGDRRWWR